MTSNARCDRAKLAILAWLCLSLSTLMSPAAQAQILGTAGDFGVLGGSTVTNTGSSIVRGNVGSSPGSAVVGFPPGSVVPPGTIHAGDAVAAQAQNDLTTAYNSLQARPTQFNLTGQNLGGLNLGPAVYAFSTSAQLTGVLTLNGQGNTTAQFVFKIGSTLTTASNSAVLLINGANGNNVYWAVGSSATLGTNTAFAGNILALGSITLNTGASLTCGRALAQTGAVTLDSNVITLCVPGTGGGGNDISINRLGGGGITGSQDAAFGASALFGSALFGQVDLWRSGAQQQQFPPRAPGSLKDGPATGMSDAEWMHGYDSPARHFWAVGFGGTGSLDGQVIDGTSDLKTRTAGFAAGLDHQIDPTMLVGIAGGYSNSSFSEDGEFTSGTVEGGHLGLYGVKRFGPFYLAGAAEYAHFVNETDRFIDFVISERARGHFSSDAFGGRAELGFTRMYGATSLTPFVGMSVSHLSSGGFTEDSVNAAGDPGILGLTIDSHDATSLTSSVGILVERPVPIPNGRILTPFARVAWVHEYYPDRSLDSFLTMSPAAFFSVDGTAAVSDAAKVDAGLRIDMNESLGLFAYFDGAFSDRSQSYAGNGGLRISW